MKFIWNSNEYLMVRGKNIFLVLNQKDDIQTFPHLLEGDTAALLVTIYYHVFYDRSYWFNNKCVIKIYNSM